MIYVFLANGFEETEALIPVDMLRRCELEVITVGVGGQVIKGSHGISVITDITDGDISLDDNLQMIILPGGMPGTLNLEASKQVQKAIDYCMKYDKYIAAICAAPSILGHKNILIDKKATCYMGFETQLNGAVILNEKVCTDDKIITSRGAGTALEFSFEIIKHLISEEKSNILKEAIMY